MAIIIEDDQKKSGNFLAMSGWVVIVAIIVIAAYYVFFIEPDPAIVTPPANFAALQPIAQITIMPQDVVNMPAFQAMHNSAAANIATSSIPAGRPNPFVAP